MRSSGAVQPGHGGALPLPAPAAAPAPAADGLRDVGGRWTRRSSSTTWRCCPASSRATRGPRLTMVSVGDPSTPRPLSEKLLQPPCACSPTIGSRSIPEPAPVPSPRALTRRRTWSGTSRSSSGVSRDGVGPATPRAGDQVGLLAKLFDEAGVSLSRSGSRTSALSTTSSTRLGPAPAGAATGRVGRDGQAQRRCLGLRATPSWTWPVCRHPASSRRAVRPAR